MSKHRIKVVRGTGIHEASDAAKVGEGVGHADIIQALREQGLDLTEGTYFDYLQRCRKAASRIEGDRPNGT